MKKTRKTIVTVMLAVMLALFALALAACDSCGSTPPPAPPPVKTDGITAEENTFKDWTPAEFHSKPSAYWEEKKTTEGIAYEFEGSYAEGFQTATTLAYFDAYLYNDGCVRGSMYGNWYYGYWFNIDDYGDECLTIQWIAINNTAFTRTSEATPYEQGDYEWQAGLINGGDGATRMTLIYGRAYKKAVSLEIDATEAQTSYYPGATLDTKELVIHAVREDDSKVRVRDGRCTFEYDMSSSGNVTVKVKYDGAEGQYTVHVKGITSIVLDTSEVTKNFKVGAEFNAVGLVVKAKYDDGEEETLGVTAYTVSGSCAEAGERTVTVTYGSLKAEYKIQVAGIERLELDTSAVKKVYNVGDTLEIDKIKVKAIYTDSDEIEVDIADCTANRLVLDEVGEDLDVEISYLGYKATYRITINGVIYTGKTMHNGQEVDMKVTRITDKKAIIKIGDGEPFNTGFNVNRDNFYTGFAGRAFMILWDIESDDYKDIPQIYNLNKSNNTFSVIETAGGAWHGTDKIWGNEWFTCQNYHFYILNERDIIVAMEVDKGGSGENEDNVVYFACYYTLDGNKLTLPETNEGDTPGNGYYDSTDSGGSYWFPMKNNSQPNCFLSGENGEAGEIMWKYFTVNNDGTATRRSKNA